MTHEHAFLFGTVAKSITGLPAPGPREIYLIASTGRVDRGFDIVSPSGMQPQKADVPFIMAHQSLSIPLGRAILTATASQVTGKVTFLPLGVNATADEVCAAYKHGAMTACSIGFQPIDLERRKDSPNGQGMLYKAWEPLELSACAIGMNPDAVVVAKGYNPEKLARIARATEIASSSPPLTRAEREEIVRRVLQGAPAQPAELTGYAKHKAERGRHAYEVAALQRATNPTREDRIAQAERHAARGRGHGLDDVAGGN